jgi:hypothetical protein
MERIMMTMPNELKASHSVPLPFKGRAGEGLKEDTGRGQFMTTIQGSEKRSKMSSVNLCVSSVKLCVIFKNFRSEKNIFYLRFIKPFLTCENYHKYYNKFLINRQINIPVKLLSQKAKKN